MARTELERAVLPSLLDRLTDDAPRMPSDPPTTRADSARRFRESVQRDLDWLLNTRRTMVQPETALPELATSVHDYGLRDFTGLTTSDEGWREQLVRNVRESIRRFEPRLVDVRVAMVESETPIVQQVRFSISATLLMDPSPEQIVFDTVLDLSKGSYELEDQS